MVLFAKIGVFIKKTKINASTKKIENFPPLRITVNVNETMVLVFAHFLSFFFGIKTKFPMYHVENFGFLFPPLLIPS